MARKRAKKSRITYKDIAHTKVGMANLHKVAELWSSKPKKKSNKFGAIKVVIDGIKFDSTGEGERYKFLKSKLAAGVIRDLRLQVKYELTPKYEEKDGTKVRAMNYVADFVYFNVLTGEEVVEDFKGRRTQSYKDKRKQMKIVHDIEIYETNRKTLKDGVL